MTQTYIANCTYHGRTEHYAANARCAECERGKFRLAYRKEQAALRLARQFDPKLPKKIISCTFFI